MAVWPIPHRHSGSISKVCTSFSSRITLPTIFRDRRSSWRLARLRFAILAVTRPVEGVAYATPLLAMLLWQYRERTSALLRIAIPALLLACAALAGLTVYLKAVTGSRFVTAYQISQKAYGWPMAL